MLARNKHTRNESLPEIFKYGLDSITNLALDHTVSHSLDILYSSSLQTSKVQLFTPVPI